jgi:hypothetical protein
MVLSDMHSRVLYYCLKNFILTYSFLTDVKPFDAVHVASFLSELYYSILEERKKERKKERDKERRENYLMHVQHTYYY